MRGRRKGQSRGAAGGSGARGVFINEVVRQKILATHDLALLERLLVQAATADLPADVLTAAA